MCDAVNDTMLINDIDEDMTELDMMMMMMIMLVSQRTHRLEGACVPDLVQHDAHHIAMKRTGRSTVTCHNHHWHHGDDGGDGDGDCDEVDHVLVVRAIVFACLDEGQHSMDQRRWDITFEFGDAHRDACISAHSKDRTRTSLVCVLLPIHSIQDKNTSLFFTSLC